LLFLIFFFFCFFFLFLIKYRTFDEKSGGCGYGQISENVLSQLKNVKNM